MLLHVLLVILEMFHSLEGPLPELTESSSITLYVSEPPGLHESTPPTLNPTILQNATGQVKIVELGAGVHDV